MNHLFSSCLRFTGCLIGLSICEIYLDAHLYLSRALYLNILGLIFIVSLCVLDGLVIYGVYHKCDLLTEKKITSNDQVRCLKWV